MNHIEHMDGHCPICNGSDFLTSRFGLLVCESCGLVLSPTIWNEQANELMEEEWFGEEYECRKSSFWVEWFESRNNEATLSRLKKFLPRTKRLLEIGVGSGSFLNSAKELGYDVYGCDLSVPICRQVEKNIGVPMHCGPLSTISAGEGTFDVVVMNHVLEHVQQPVEFLQDVHQNLTTGGIVHIAIPNIACWEAYLTGWTSYEPYHLTYFDRHSLVRAIEAAGFSVDSIISRDSFSGWFLTLLRTALGVNRNHGAITRAASLSVGVPTHRRTDFVEHAYRLTMVLFGWVTWPLRWLQGWLGYGDEIICIASKRVLVPGE